MTILEGAAANNLLDEIARAIGETNVSDDQQVLSTLSSDLFSCAKTETPVVACRPSSTREVVSILNAAKAFGRPVFVRGGGMSYTNAYGPTAPDSIMIDLRGLNAIREIDVTNRFIVVESGCTWRDVVEALKPHDMIVDFPAPLSGSHSTVGGAISQNVPGGMQGVLGLEVALASGAVIRTGAWSSTSNSKPFCRNYGPDLTGLFIGDNGIMGIKTAVSLHIKHKPKGAAYGSFAFESYEDMADAMIALSPMDFISRRTGLCPYETANIAKVGLGDAVNTLSQVVNDGDSWFSGVKSAAQIASAGLGFLDGVKWSLHLKVDGISDRAADEGMELARKVCLKRGRELPPVLPRAREAVGFAIRKFLGREGERWVAVNSLWPIGRATEVAVKTQDFFAQRSERMRQMGVTQTFITNFSPYYFLCEPCFYWNDSLTALHLDNISTAEAEKFAKYEPNLAARSYVRDLRYELRDFFREMGSIHVQIGDFYHFPDVIMPEVEQVLSGIKRTLDPGSMINPGKLSGLKP